MNAMSLRGRLILVILPPLLLLSILMGLWRYHKAQLTTEELYDRALLTVALAISRDVTVSGGDALGHATTDLIREASNGVVYYHVVGPDGVFVTGFATPPVAPAEVRDITNRPVYYDAKYRSEQVRAVRLREPVQIDTLGGYSVVTVWEPLARRAKLAQTLAWRSITLMVILLTTVAAVVWFGVQIGLRPLNDLQAAVSQRGSRELRPIKRALPKETQALVATINHLFAQLQETINSRDVFISSAAHQLRNPAAALLSVAEAINGAPHHKDIAQRTGKLVSAARHLSRLTNQLLSFERVQSPGQLLAESFDLEKIARPIITRNAEIALRRGLILELHADDGPYLVLADPIEFEEALENVLHNALTHSGAALTRISVSILGKEEHIELSVSDDGKGIPVAQQETALERFVQVGSNQGSGLGLSIASNAMRRVGGQLELCNNHPGLTVSLCFLRHQAT